MEVIITRSKKKDKKYDALIDGSKTISFGLKGASDFTLNRDEDRKGKYLSRHRKRENWNDPNTAGFYATNLLWNKTTLQSSAADVNQRFKNVRIKLKI
jgi:hypothetical protein